MKAPVQFFVMISFLPVLAGCDLIDPPDPRTLTEPVAECVARFAKTERELAAEKDENLGRPIYTFDVTKLPFGDLQELIVPGSDETVGQRLMRRTNEASTAVAEFRTWPVDEAGIFFLGRDPALYRVRVADIRPRDMVQTGCDMQRQGMRLTDIQTTEPVVLEQPTETDPDDDSPSTESTI